MKDVVKTDIICAAHTVQNAHSHYNLATSEHVGTSGANSPFSPDQKWITF